VADLSDDSLLREIDEELQQEKYAKLWKAYGKYVIAAVVVVVAVVAGYQGWRAYEKKVQLEEGARFAAALRLADSQPDAAREAFAKLGEDAVSGYGVLARFQKAAIQAKSGDRAGAARAYAILGADTSLDVIYRDLAVILGALHEMDGTPSPDLERRLAPLMADANPWHHSAREIVALLAMHGGDTKKARDLFKGIADDAAAPGGMRQRARELMAVLGK